jgi:hypothetical protein
MRVIGVRYRVQNRDQRERHRPAEVQQLCGLGEDRGSVAQVGVDVLGGTRLVAVQEGAGVGEDDRVIGNVHDRAREQSTGNGRCRMHTRAARAKAE